MTVVSSQVDSERREVAERLARLRGSKVHANGAKVIPLKKVEEKTKFEVGEAVEALWSGDEIYYRGKIAAVGVGCVTVAFDDGSVDCVRNSRVMRLASDAPRRSRPEVRHEISKLYRRHNPAKLAIVDQLLDKCGAGNEEALLAAIQRKYATRDPALVAVEVASRASSAASSFAARAEIFYIYAAKCPTRATFDIPVGSEHELLVTLRCKYCNATKRTTTSRAEVVREIVRSEEEFCFGLRSLEERIAVPLRRLNRHHSYVEEVVKLVSECDGGIGRLSEKLRSDLDGEVCSHSDVGNARIGAIFRRFGPFFKMFASYARRFHDTVHARAILSGYFEDDDDYCGLDVSGALAAPVDRLRRYEALLADLVRHTPADHDDRNDALLALDLVRDALKHVNQTLACDVAFKRLTQILDATSLSSLLDVPTRKLVKESKLDQIVFGATGGRIGVIPLRSLALSDRILLVSLPKTVVLSKKKGTLLYNFPIPEISDVEACADGIGVATAPIARKSGRNSASFFSMIDDDDLLFGCDDTDRLFRIDTIHATSVVLRADSREARDDWIRTLADLRQRHVDRSSVTLQLQRANSQNSRSSSSPSPAKASSSKGLVVARSPILTMRRRRSLSLPEEELASSSSSSRVIRI